MAFYSESGWVRGAASGPQPFKSKSKIASTRKKKASQVSILHVDGLTVHVTRKDMKNTRLKVDSKGQVLVSAPFAVSDQKIASFVSSKIDWIKKQQQNESLSIMERANNATPEEIEEWRKLIKACVPPLVDYWEPILGVKVGTLAYRNMKSRWGSCQPSTGRVCINIRLALYPPECLEYVVVHELCHFHQQNHGPGFKYLLDKHLPNWRLAEQKLRK